MKLVSVILIISILVAISTPCLGKGQGIATEENIQNYVEEFMKTYTQQVEDNFSSQRGYFNFYAKFPYKIDATISNAHGAAIEFIPGGTRRDIITTDQRIDLAVFPDIDLSQTMTVEGGVL